MEMYTCDKCGAEACEDCIAECEACDEFICPGCAKECKECRSTVCKEHASECLGCNRLLCDACLDSDSLCDKCAIQNYGDLKVSRLCWYCGEKSVIGNKCLNCDISWKPAEKRKAVVLETFS